jgi:DNA-binding response OmpR family regulator
MALPDERVCVLMVEDCPATADSIRHVLAQAGCDVRLAPDGTVALALVSRLRPAAVVVAAAVPGRAWLNVAWTFRLVFGDDGPPLVAASRLDGQEVRRRAWEAGFDHFLSEPFDLDHLQVLGATAPVLAGV